MEPGGGVQHPGGGEPLELELLEGALLLVEGRLEGGLGLEGRWGWVLRSWTDAALGTGPRVGEQGLDAEGGPAAPLRLFVEGHPLLDWRRSGRSVLFAAGWRGLPSILSHPRYRFHVPPPIFLAAPIVSLLSL